MNPYLLYFALAAAMIGFGIGLYLWLEVERLQRALEDAQTERDELLALQKAQSASASTVSRDQTYDD